MITLDKHGRFAELDPANWDWDTVVVHPGLRKSDLDAANEMLAKAEAARSERIHADMKAKVEALNKAMRPLQARRRVLAKTHRPKPQLAKSMRWSTLLDELAALEASDRKWGFTR